jgi:hypothetical protein
MNKPGMAGPAEGVAVLSFLSLVIVDYRDRPVFEQIECTESLKRCVDDLSAAVGAKDWLMLEDDNGPALCFWGDPRHCCKIAWGLAERLRQHPPGAPLQTRIGINLGPVAVVRNGTSQPRISGEGIELARAVAAAAEFSEVLATRTYVDVVAQVGVPGTRFAAIGTVSFAEKKYPIYRLEPDSSASQPARAMDAAQTATPGSQQTKLSAAKASGSAPISTKRARFVSRTLHSIALPILAIAATIGALGLFSRQNGEAVQSTSALSGKPHGARLAPSHAATPQTKPATPSSSSAVETQRIPLAQGGSGDSSVARHPRAADSDASAPSGAAVNATANDVAMAEIKAPELPPSGAALTPPQAMAQPAYDVATEKTQVPDASIPAVASAQSRTESTATQPREAAEADRTDASMPGVAAPKSRNDAAAAQPEVADTARPDRPAPPTPAPPTDHMAKAGEIPGADPATSPPPKAAAASNDDTLANQTQAPGKLAQDIATPLNRATEKAPSDAATATSRPLEEARRSVATPSDSATEKTAHDAATALTRPIEEPAQNLAMPSNPSTESALNVAAKAPTHPVEEPGQNVAAPSPIATDKALPDAATAPTPPVQEPGQNSATPSNIATDQASANTATAPTNPAAEPGQNSATPSNIATDQASADAATAPIPPVQEPGQNVATPSNPAIEKAFSEAAPPQTEAVEEPGQNVATPSDPALEQALRDAATAKTEVFEEPARDAAMSSGPAGTAPARKDTATVETQAAEPPHEETASNTLPTEDTRSANAAPDAQPAAGSEVNSALSGKGATAQRAAQAAATFATGTLFLLVRPWGEVFVDGKRIGVTPPLKQLRLSTGKRVIVVRNRHLPAYARTVEIKAKTTTTVNHNFN